jgi:hypothetical protein
MRAAEWVQIVFVALLALAAWLPPLQRGRRIRVTLLAVVAMLAIVAARFSEHWISPLASSVLRDWLPAALMLVPYWQVGQFFVGSDPAMEMRLTNFDRMIFRRLRIHPAETPISSVLATYLQLAYVMVYPLVPAALVVFGFLQNIFRQSVGLRFLVFAF